MNRYLKWMELKRAHDRNIGDLWRTTFDDLIWETEEEAAAREAAIVASLRYDCDRCGGKGTLHGFQEGPGDHGWNADGEECGLCGGRGRTKDRHILDKGFPWTWRHVFEHEDSKLHIYPPSAPPA